MVTPEEIGTVGIFAGLESARYIQHTLGRMRDRAVAV
jgi:hypothetical protein